MEFDKLRVYTALNADELKVGSKVIASDCLADIKERVNLEVNMSTLVKIHDDTSTYRFELSSGSQFALAYLVSEPEEKKLEWIDLKIGDVITNGTRTAMVTAKDDEYSCVHIYAGQWLTNKGLKDWKKVE